MITVQMNVAASGAAIPMTLSTQTVGISAALGADYKMKETASYGGPLTVVPSDEPQTLETAGKKMLENIVVQPVPSGYGRITWNGSFLTVS